MRRISSAAWVLKITPSKCGSMASSLEGWMLSQAHPDRTFPPHRPSLSSTDEVKHPVEDLLMRIRAGLGSRIFEPADQEAEPPHLGNVPEEPGTPVALFQEMAHEIPVLSPGELRSEEALDDLMREVLIRHVIPPERLQTLDLHQVRLPEDGILGQKERTESFFRIRNPEPGGGRLEVGAKPALGGVQCLDELWRGAGERMTAAESVVGRGNDEQLLLAARPLGETLGLRDRHALVFGAVHDQPGRAASRGGGEEIQLGPVLLDVAEQTEPESQPLPGAGVDDGQLPLAAPVLLLL